MYLTGIRVQGLRGADGYAATALDRVVELAPGPEGVAVADALTLFAASLPVRRGEGAEATAVRRALATLGLATATDAEVLVEGGFPVQATLASGAPVPALLPVGAGRQVTVHADISLDPPLFGRLRGHAVRDPRLVSALGEGAHLSIKVGWLFSTDLSAVSISINGVAVGDTAFPVVGSERPAWLTELLAEVGHRFARVGWSEPVELAAGRLVEAALSVDPDRRSRFRSSAEALSRPPFVLGELALVRLGERVEPCFGPGLLRARQFGPAGAEALRLVDAVFLEAPDVLVVEAPGCAQRDPGAVRTWLADHARGEGATLEQVFLVPGGAGPVLGAA